MFSNCDIDEHQYTQYLLFGEGTLLGPTSTLHQDASSRGSSLIDSFKGSLLTALPIGEGFVETHPKQFQYSEYCEYRCILMSKLEDTSRYPWSWKLLVIGSPARFQFGSEEKICNLETNLTLSGQEGQPVRRGAGGRAAGQVPGPLVPRQALQGVRLQMPQDHRPGRPRAQPRRQGERQPHHRHHREPPR